MAAPTYATDLSDITTVESGDSFFEFTGYTKGDGAAIETDWYLQGNACASDENNNKTGVGHSIGYDNSTNVSYTSGDCVFVWMMSQGPNAIDTYANGGYRILAGSSTSSFGAWYVGGSNMPPNPYGGWVNVVADPTVTVDAGSQPSTSTLRYFGAGFNFVAGISKGRPVNMDAVRFGRGQLSVINGEGPSSYGTFAGMATANDGISARWGLFQEVLGGYRWKGLMSLGTTTAVDFRDANANIAIDDTPKVTSGFNKIEINNSSSNVEWTSVSITAPSSSVHGSIVSKGSFEVVDNATVDLDGCTFTDMNTFIFNGGTNTNTVTDTVFRRCAQVTQGGATFTGCLFDEATSTTALSVDNLAIVTGCTFNSDGTGHAINLGTISSSTTLNWNNDDNGYASTDGSTGNETILVNYTDTVDDLTINVGAGYTTPTVYNTGAGTVNVVAGQVTLNITVQDIDTGSKIQNARVYVFADTGGPLTQGTAIIDKVLTDVNGLASDTRSYASDQPIIGRVRSASGTPYYKTSPIAGTIDSASGLSLTIQMIKDE